MNQNMNKEQKKLGFFSTTTMAIGGIVGAGVFGTIPAAAAMVGTGIEWAYVIAFLAMIVSYLPQMVTISTLPSPFTNYMHASRLVNPVIGYIPVISGFNYVFILSALAGVFAEYAGVYIPIDHRILAVCALAIFAFITTRGVQANALVQNIMVISLFVALFLYMILGMPEIKSEYLTFSDIIAPKNISLVAMGSAVVLLSSSLQGAVSVAFYADEIKNPGKTVPRVFIIATGVCCLTFMLVSTITIGVLPLDQVTSLLDVAKIVLSPALYNFFILAGAIFAVLTSLNGVFIAGGHVGSTTADDKVMPEWFGRRNSHKVPHNTVWLLAVVSALLVVSGFPIGTLLTAFSMLNLFVLLILFVPALRVKKLYPHSFQHASFKMPLGLIAVMTVFGVAVCIWQLISTCITLDTRMIVTIIIWYALWYSFYFVRRWRLKTQGFDLDQQMRTPYPEWVKKESELAERDSGEI